MTAESDCSHDKKKEINTPPLEIEKDSEVMNTVTCNIEYVGSIRQLTGSRTDLLHLRIGTTIREIIGVLSEKYGNNFEKRMLTVDDTLRANVLIFLNGREVSYQDDLSSITIVKETQSRIITLVPAEEGG